MKKFWLIYFLFTSISFCQDLGSYNMEILPQTQGFDSTEEILFIIQPVDVQAYCLERITSNWFEDDANSSQELIIGNYNHLGGLPSSPNYGFDVCYSDDGGYPKFWLTVNKVIIKYYDIDDFYFFIDYRDCSYGNNNNDITIRFVRDVGYYISPGINLNTNLNGFSSINLGQYYRIGQINSYNNYSTSCIPNYWQNSLALIPSQTGNHPRLIWGPHPTFNVSSYRIYRAVSNTPVNKPMTLSYSLIQQNIPSTTFEFTDNAVTILPGYQYAYYYVVGWNGTSESAKTNYVGTPAEFHKVQVPESDTEIPKKFSLHQNYPNPFNPNTTIKFALPVKTNFSLNIYNTLGERVAEVFNGEMEEGYHEINFNASSLSSGIYFYKIESENFNSTKKMIVMK